MRLFVWHFPIMKAGRTSVLHPSNDSFRYYVDGWDALAHGRSIYGGKLKRGGKLHAAACNPERQCPQNLGGEHLGAGLYSLELDAEASNGRVHVHLCKRIQLRVRDLHGVSGLCSASR